MCNPEDIGYITIHKFHISIQRHAAISFTFIFKYSSIFVLCLNIVLFLRKIGNKLSY